jgi:DHA1 family multidrug resistance protein-like MFS transporter
VTEAALARDDTPEGALRRITLSIAGGAGVASFAMNFWIPFLPLYMRQIGANSNADALLWVGIATTTQGVARLVSGPFWGVLSDRFGRKLMLVRALFAATLTTVVASFATEPWHIAVALGAQGLFSGFIPAAIALTSVSVPDARMNRSLGTVTAGQYIGSTLGPAVGGFLAIVLGYRGAIFAGAMLPSVAALWIVFAVPRDRVGRAARTVEAVPAAPLRRRMLGAFPAQLYLAVFLYGALFTLSSLVRQATPVVLEDLGGAENAKAATGIIFTLSGAASVVGILLVAAWLNRSVPVRTGLIVLCLAAAPAHLLLAGAGVVPVYALGFVAVSLLNGATIPATNTLIASTVDPSRRGTAFGLASSAQAVAFMVGPLGAAVFAATSFALGFALTGAVFVLLALLLLAGLREPQSAGPMAPTAHPALAGEDAGNN